MNHLTRRDFIKLCGASSFNLFLAACGVTPSPVVTPAPTNTELPASPTSSVPSSALSPTTIIPTASSVPKPGSRAPIETVSFEGIDRYALSVPKTAEGSVDGLASYLSQGARNDLEKTRAIYRWITQNISYDYQAFLTKNYGNTSATGVLASRASVCEGYSGLFQSLAQAAGLQVVGVTGWAKGIGYVVGDSITGPTNHAWNAVKLFSGWYLVDPTWGAGSIRSQQFVREFNDYYFLTPPSEFIYEHLPQKSEWQLLDSPLSTESFSSLPHARSAFFKNNLGFENYAQGVITADREIAVLIKAPVDVLLLAEMEQAGIRLSERLVFVQRAGGRYQISAIFPSAGDYTLEIFAKNQADSGYYELAVEYRIKVREGSPGLIGFPVTYGAFIERAVHLYTPMVYDLKPGTQQYFKLDVPGAAEVAIVMGGKWYHLKKLGASFEGTFSIVRGEVKVYARFPPAETYDGMLMYAGQ